MEYKARHLESKIRETAKHFKIVLILGARQVGKSTLLHHVFPNAPVVLFDPLQDIYNAREDPDLFLNNFSSPLILDEVQYVPEGVVTEKEKNRTLRFKQRPQLQKKPIAFVTSSCVY